MSEYTEKSGTTHFGFREVPAGERQKLAQERG